jgi:hypothetical protein
MGLEQRFLCHLGPTHRSRDRVDGDPVMFDESLTLAN